MVTTGRTQGLNKLIVEKLRLSTRRAYELVAEPCDAGLFFKVRRGQYELSSAAVSQVLAHASYLCYLIIEMLVWLWLVVRHKRNRKARKAGRKCIAEDCPVIVGDYNVPIFQIIPGIDGTGWHECVLPANPDCETHVVPSVGDPVYCRLSVVTIPQA